MEFFKIKDSQGIWEFHIKEEDDESFKQLSKKIKKLSNSLPSGIKI